MKESSYEETATSEAVLELQKHLNDANEEVTELKQMLEEAGEAFTEKEAEISKLRAALDDQIEEIPIAGNIPDSSPQQACTPLIPK